MYPIETSQDPKWYRLIDGIVILNIGLVIGMLVAYWFAISQLPSERIINIPVKVKTDTNSGQNVESLDPSSSFFKIEES